MLEHLTYLLWWIWVKVDLRATAHFFMRKTIYNSSFVEHICFTSIRALVSTGAVALVLFEGESLQKNNFVEFQKKLLAKIFSRQYFQNPTEGPDKYMYTQIKSVQWNTILPHTKP